MKRIQKLVLGILIILTGTLSGCVNPPHGRAPICIDGGGWICVTAQDWASAKRYHDHEFERDTDYGGSSIRVSKIFTTGKLKGRLGSVDEIFDARFPFFLCQVADRQDPTVKLVQEDCVGHYGEPIPHTHKVLHKHY
jgi:hypothetical protein